MNTLLLATIALPAFAFACASGADRPAPAAAEPTTVDRAAPSTALLELRGGHADYMFVLDESAPASTFRARCAAQHPVDPAAADACYAEVREGASHEGVRFSVDADKHLVFTSFGLEGGHEATYLQVPTNVASEGDRIVAMIPAAAARGLQTDVKPLPRNAVMHVELVDDLTIAMTDPQKGRLVYRRAP